MFKANKHNYSSCHYMFMLQSKQMSWRVFCKGKIMELLQTSISLSFISSHNKAEISSSGVRSPCVTSSQMRVEVIESRTLVTVYSKVTVSIVRTANPDLTKLRVSTLPLSLRISYYYLYSWQQLHVKVNNCGSSCTYCSN